MPKSKIIQNGELATFNDFKMNEKIFVTSALLIKDAVVVQTTNKEIYDNIENLKNMDKTELIALSNKVYKIIISTNVDSIYNKKKEWQNFCDDLIIVYATRNVLYNSPIPIMPYEEFKKHKIEEKEKNPCVKCSK